MLDSVTQGLESLLIEIMILSGGASCIFLDS